MIKFKPGKSPEEINEHQYTVNVDATIAMFGNETMLNIMQDMHGNQALFLPTAFESLFERTRPLPNYITNSPISNSDDQVPTR